MRRSWLRLLVCSFVIVAALSAAAPMAFASPASHHPCAEMTIGGGGHSDHGKQSALPRPCDSLICGAVQVSPVVFVEETVDVRTSRAPQPRDDAARLGFTGSPDLRPPIS